uniref:Reverse transcriptase domain-containing protein n=1 Tax=Tanacetum cinerariifolium TaxID=118510 RepID=A0A699H2S1_TANCI|nr:reverse transcriptase domain-containing protein [Tanacetum cinerariifolium]
MMPPLGFSTPPQIPNITTSERPLVTTTVFAATTPENTPFAYHASTSTNPSPMISPAFVEASYEILEALLIESQRHIRNEDLRTEFEYFSEDYDEEREMEPRLEPRREATLTLWLRSHGVRRQQERVIRFERTKMPFHVGSYDGKGDPYNFLHLFEGAIPMQKWLISVACHMFTHTLKDSTRIWWNSQKAGFVHGLRTRSLVEHLYTYLPSTYKGLMEKTYTWIEAREILPLPRTQSRFTSQYVEKSKGNSRQEKDARSFEPPQRCSEASDREICPSTITSMKITDTIPIIVDTSELGFKRL